MIKVGFLYHQKDLAVVSSFWFTGSIKKEEEIFLRKGRRKTEQKRKMVICQCTCTQWKGIF